MAFIACPICKGNLYFKKDNKIAIKKYEGEYWCSACKKSYPIIEGIPRMVVDSESYEEEKLYPSHLKRFVVTPKKIEDRQENKKIALPRFIGKVILITRIPSFKVIRVFYLLVSFFFLIVGLYKGLSDTTLLVGAGFLGIAISIWILDYLIYRLKHIENFNSSLKILDYILRKGERNVAISEINPEGKSFIEDKKTTEEKDQNHLIIWKNKRITNILEHFKAPGNIAVNIGCGGYRHRMVSQPYFNNGFKMIGVDIREQNLKEFSNFFNTEGILANASMLPLAGETFSLVNCTDVIEHLYNPLLLVDELGRILKKEGILILTTENRTSFGFFENNPLACYSFNPLIFIERFIGVFFNRILPQSTMLDTWQGMVFYHAQFSPREIKHILKRAGLKILQHETVFPHPRLEWLNRILNKLPGLRFMAYSHLIIAIKV